MIALTTHILNSFLFCLFFVSYPDAIKNDTNFKSLLLHACINGFSKSNKGIYSVELFNFNCKSNNHICFVFFSINSLYTLITSSLIHLSFVIVFICNVNFPNSTKSIDLEESLSKLPKNSVISSSVLLTYITVFLFFNLEPNNLLPYRLRLLIVYPDIFINSIFALYELNPFNTTPNTSELILYDVQFIFVLLPFSIPGNNGTKLNEPLNIIVTYSITLTSFAFASIIIIVVHNIATKLDVLNEISIFLKCGHFSQSKPLSPQMAPNNNNCNIICGNDSAHNSLTFLNL
mmetsp:Transcript_24423/g.29810  ORF Transcript_24423/g.29810 Transcript_24423/m.29810 type:complete len:289 (-) Transcript_24423:97-963(-)